MSLLCSFAAVSPVVRFFSEPPCLQVLTGLFLSFLRMLGFARDPSEFLLRRSVFFVASILLDSSSCALYGGYDVLFTTLNICFDPKGLNLHHLSNSSSCCGVSRVSLNLKSHALCSHEFPHCEHRRRAAGASGTTSRFHRPSDLRCVTWLYSALRHPSSSRSRV